VLRQANQGFEEVKHDEFDGQNQIKQGESFIKLVLGSKVHELREDGPPIEGEVRLQVAVGCEMNLVELEFEGV
jgi:hypothetical protein